MRTRSALLKKVLGFVVCLVAGFDWADAKWVPYAKTALIQHADAIVIADYLGYHPVPQQSIYDQLGSFVLARNLKGNVEPNFSVYGCSAMICAPLIFFKDLKPGRYLLFLSKRQFGWTDCSAAVVPIQNDKLSWFRSDDNVDQSRSQQSLSVVIQDIQKHLRPDH